MATPSSTVPAAAAAAGPGSTSDDVGMLQYVQEVAAGTTAVPAEALPVVGTLRKTLLAFEQLVKTARSNKDDLTELRGLCDVVVKGVLDKRPRRSGLPKEGFEKLKEHLGRAESVAKLCNGVGIEGSVKRVVLARKISNEIAAIRSDVLAFCSMNNLADDTVVSNSRRHGQSSLC